MMCEVNQGWKFISCLDISSLPPWNAQKLTVGNVNMHMSWALSHKKVLKGLSRCHTKRGMGTRGRAIPSFGRRLFRNVILWCQQSQILKKSVSYQKTDSCHYGPFCFMHQNFWVKCFPIRIWMIIEAVRGMISKIMNKKMHRSLLISIIVCYIHFMDGDGENKR